LPLGKLNFYRLSPDRSEASQRTRILRAALLPTQIEEFAWRTLESSQSAGTNFVHMAAEQMPLRSHASEPSRWWCAKVCQQSTIKKKRLAPLFEE